MLKTCMTLETYWEGEDVFVIVEKSMTEGQSINAMCALVYTVDHIIITTSHDPDHSACTTGRAGSELCDLNVLTLDNSQDVDVTF